MCFHNFLLLLTLSFQRRGLQPPPEGDAHLILEASPQHWGHSPPTPMAGAAGKGGGRPGALHSREIRLGLRLSLALKLEQMT